MRAIQRTRSRTSNQPACNLALFTLLLEDDFQSETVNFARLQLPFTYNFPNKWGAGMIGTDVARSTPVRNCFGTGRTFTWNHSRKQDGWVLRTTVGSPPSPAGARVRTANVACAPHRCSAEHSCGEQATFAVPTTQPQKANSIPVARIHSILHFSRCARASANAIADF